MKMIEFKKSGGGLCAIAIKKIIRLNPVDSSSRLTNIILSNGDFGRRYVLNVYEICKNNETVSVGNLERRFDDTGVLS